MACDSSWSWPTSGLGLHGDDVAVEPHLLVGEGAVPEVLDLGRQLLQHLVLGPAHLERVDQLLQGDASSRDRPSRPRPVQERTAEVLIRAEIAGDEEIEEVLQLAEMVLHRRAGKADADPAAEPAGGLVGGGVVVFDEVRFVEDQRVPDCGRSRWRMSRSMTP